MKNLSPFRYFKTSPEVIRLAVMMYVRFPLSLRNVEDLLHERGIEISHETVRYWWNRFGPMFAAEIRRKRIDRRCQSKIEYSARMLNSHLAAIDFPRVFGSDPAGSKVTSGIRNFALSSAPLRCRARIADALLLIPCATAIETSILRDETVRRPSQPKTQGALSEESGLWRPAALRSFGA